MQAGSYWMAYQVRMVDISLQIWISHEFNETMNIRPMLFNFDTITYITAISAKFYNKSIRITIYWTVWITNGEET